MSEVVNFDSQSTLAAMTLAVVWIVVGAWQTDSALRATTPLQAPLISTVGALQGVVREDFGSFAAGVVVLATAVHVDTGGSSDGNSYWTTTDNGGRYRFQGVSPGRYRISAGRPGFSTFYPGTLDADRSTSPYQYVVAGFSPRSTP
jgi:Carboxypeptidase regulatory-like domain